ncbi:MAG: WG repeat-containing protein [Clostridia bacterium]|nr:WG repeat-containing protein [Clostridia bacterium]
MIKRAAGMLAISAVLCGAVAALTPAPAPQDNGSAPEEQLPAELVPTADTVAFETAEPAVGIAREIGLKDILIPASDYGQIFPYAAEIVGWKEDGSAVYRYALADEAGELITNPVYTKAQRLVCEDSFVWLLTDAEGLVSCAARDGSWMIGAVSGSITAEDGYIFVQQADSPDTEVYNSSGKLLHDVAGSMVSCSDGIIVSRKTTDTSDIWHIYDADTISELTSLTAYQIGAFSEGYASMQISENQWAIVDEKGVITPFSNAAWMDDVCDGYVLVEDTEGKFGVIDVSGKEAVAFDYINGSHCSDDYPLYQLWKSADECIVISANKGQRLKLPENLSGQPLVGLPNSYFSYTDAENGCTVIFDDLKSISLEDRAIFYQQKNSLIAIQGDSYQIFDLDDGKISSLISYQYVVPEQPAALSDTVFTIADTETGLQGIGNIHGKMVIKPEYDSISSVGDTYYMAVQDGWSGIVDSRGRWIVRTQLSGVK